MPGPALSSLSRRPTPGRPTPRRPTPRAACLLALLAGVGLIGSWPQGAAALPQELDLGLHCVNVGYYLPVFSPTGELLVVCRLQLCEVVRDDGAPFISGAFIGWLEWDCRSEEPT